jgi:kynurenine formamidase
LPDSVGMYPVDRFIGTTAVLDFSPKLVRIFRFFGTDGKLAISPRDEVAISRFINSWDELVISRRDVEAALEFCGGDTADLRGIIFYTSLGDFWKYEKLESWEYVYFYSPYLGRDACNMLIEKRLSFVGVDSLQLEHPAINFSSHELPFVLNCQARQNVVAKIKELACFSSHVALLGSDVLIYENLRIPGELKSSLVQFHGVPLNMRLEAMNDNALVRPYCYVRE